MAAAGFLADGGYYKAACYHAQQAVEKALKGRLLAKGWELEKVHNLARLLSLCADYAVDVRITAEDVAFVDSIYRGRDPGEAGLLPAGDPTEPDARRGIAIAEALLAPRQ